MEKEEPSDSGELFVQAHGTQGAASVFSCVLTAFCSRSRTWRKALFGKKHPLYSRSAEVRKANSFYYFQEWKIFVCHGQVIIIQIIVIQRELKKF